MDVEQQRINRELFGRTLQGARAKIGKTRDEVSKSLEVNNNSVYKWETAEVFPSEDKVDKIAEVYGIDPSELERCYQISRIAKKSLSDGGKKSRKKYPAHNPYAPSEVGRSGRAKARWPSDHRDHDR